MELYGNHEMYCSLGELYSLRDPILRIGDNITFRFRRGNSMLHATLSLLHPWSEPDGR